jgi:hypothetical protein
MSSLINCFPTTPDQQEYIDANNAAIEAEAQAELDVLLTQKCKVPSRLVGNRVLLGIWPKERRPFPLYPR